MNTSLSVSMSRYTLFVNIKLMAGIGVMVAGTDIVSSVLAPVC